MQRILTVQFVNKDENIINAYSENEERNDFGNDQSYSNTKEGEESDSGRDREENQTYAE